MGNKVRMTRRCIYCEVKDQTVNQIVETTDVISANRGLSGSFVTNVDCEEWDKSCVGKCKYSK